MSERKASGSGKIQVTDHRSFAEVLVTEAFTPGVRPQSFDCVNISLGALLFALLCAIIANPSNYHLYLLGLIALGLGGLMVRYRDDFLEASNVYEQHAAKLAREKRHAKRREQGLDSDTEPEGSDSESESDDEDQEKEEEQPEEKSSIKEGTSQKQVGSNDTTSSQQKQDISSNNTNNIECSHKSDDDKMNLNTAPEEEGLRSRTTNKKTSKET